MKNITKKSIERDLNIIQQMCSKYTEAIFEKQEHQPAHFDNQLKNVRLAMVNIHCGLLVARNALACLSNMEILED